MIALTLILKLFEPLLRYFVVLLLDLHLPLGIEHILLRFHLLLLTFSELLSKVAQFMQLVGLYVLVFF